ncbi:MAG: SrfA family protein [Aeromonas sp.]
MQGSIQGPLLRSGQNCAFKALGETGFPVYRMASQLREAIRRLDNGHDLARHLAIPKNNVTGDLTDWYSSFAGDVIRWDSATASERAAASVQFEAFRSAVLALSDRLLSSESDERHAGGDKRAFASLLRQVIHFPDQDFVYLVNGVLVITFWGFVHDKNELQDPMHWLVPVTAPTPTPAPSAVAPILAAAPIASMAQPIPLLTEPLQPEPYRGSRWCGWHSNWRNWHWRCLLWPLLLLALLALLLFGLRSCAPRLSLPGLPAIGLPTLDEPVVDSTAAVPVADPLLPLADNSAQLVENVNVDADPLSLETRDLGAGDIPVPAPDSLADTQPLASNEPLEPAALAQTSAPNSPSADNQAPTLPAAGAEGAGKNVPPAPTLAPAAAPAPAGADLQIPAATANGPAHFLNGDWKVNGGIQDTQTGKPLQLQYQFHEGKGQVSLRKSNGVVCQGPANGAMADGQLNITNPGPAACSDGTSYIIPKIKCQPDTKNSADCMGSNDGEQQFPIQMRQKNPSGQE